MPDILSRLLAFAAAALVAVGLAAPVSAAKAPALTTADRADLARVEAYLNGITTLKARFLQVAPDGSYAEGNAYVARPGRMRLEYDPPTPILVVADGRFLVYHDKQLQQTSYLGLDQTPAGILLRPQINLSGDGDVRAVAVERRPGVLNVTLRHRDPANGDLILVFSENPFALRQWKVIDAQGQMTQVSLFQTQANVTLDPKLFTFDDPKMRAAPLDH
ncbi:MAG: outer-membrane lipoprotein carrier protein LolA [Rhodospirillales bacterium]|nr:outer-membrane lipoprotein carrier protein LolA [Rhodospirillales bacterium]